MRTLKVMAALGMAAVLSTGGVMTVCAADVAEGTVATAQQEISVVKENEKPTFTVDIPATLSVTSKDAAEFTYSMSEEDAANVPEGQKVAIRIADAGYDETTGTFSLANENGTTASYGLYGSKYSVRPADKYAVGDLVASFYGPGSSSYGTTSIGRVIKVDDFDSLEDGTYTGYISYSIELISQ